MLFNLLKLGYGFSPSANKELNKTNMPCVDKNLKFVTWVSRLPGSPGCPAGSYPMP